MAFPKPVAFAGFFGLTFLLCSPVRPPAPPAPKPTLLVFLTIDQMTPMYLERFGSELHGGLARLANHGAYFIDAHQDHAITETAPGHASTMSGRFPRSTGITRNLRGVNDRDSPLIGARDLGASPTRFRGTTVTDWLTAADPATTALSISAKDRAAILPIGRSKQNVFWFSANGTLTTSTWYRDTLPDWVNAFNARRLPQSYAGKTWNLLLDPKAYPEVDSVPYEAFGRNFIFPHQIPADSAVAAAQLRFTPMMDEVTVAAALLGVRTLNLGAGPTTDVLAISLSSTDYIGHFYGPESREQHDQILRLDRLLGALFDTLYSIRDSTRIIFALTADHGAGLIPELHGKLRVNMSPAMDAARAIVKAAGGDTSIVDLESGAFFVEADRLPKGLTLDAVIAEFIRASKAIPGVLRADRFTDFAKQDTTRDYVARRWLHMFPDDILPVAAVTLAEGNMYDYEIVATHGSPHRNDSNVPVIFYGPPFKPGRYQTFTRTADIAPTLAKVLGVTPSERLDGHILTEAIR